MEPIIPQNPISAPRRRWRALLRWSPAILAVLVVAAVLLGLRLRHVRLENRLLTTLPNAAGADPALVAFATAEARPIYVKNCAACHGTDLHGNVALGAPDLVDSHWLYGTGTVYDIERTILYGIRSGHAHDHNVTEMPAYGTQGRLSAGQIDSVVQYLMKLNGRPYRAGAANVGQELFYGAPNCSDCHGSDARGDSDYGAPNLTDNVWDNGGSEQQIHDSIYNGVHRMMPAWFDVLTLGQIRALAVYIHAVSHAPPAPAKSEPGASPGVTY